MPGKEAISDEGPDRDFTTIDDAIGLAEQLLESLNKLGEYKHPLDVRRGVGRLVDKDENSKILKAGAKTYFFDIKETKDKKPFLLITESRYKGEDEERERSSIVIFEQDVDAFAEAVADIATKLT
jgi:hypothetical protein